MKLKLFKKGLIKCQAEIFFKDIAIPQICWKFWIPMIKTESYRLLGKKADWWQGGGKKSDLTFDFLTESLNVNRQNAKHSEFKGEIMTLDLAFPTTLLDFRTWKKFLDMKESQKAYDLCTLYIFEQINLRN